MGIRLEAGGILNSDSTRKGLKEKTRVCRDSQILAYEFLKSCSEYESPKIENGVLQVLWNRVGPIDANDRGRAGPFQQSS